MTIMGNPFLQDSSAGDPDASSQSQTLLHIKRLLKETRGCLDALDQSTLAGLRSDKEYKDAIVHLLSPLTTIPLSTVVNKALTCGVEAVTAQLASLLLSLDVGAEQDRKDAVDPSTTAGPAVSDITRPGKKRNMTSRYQSIIAKWKRGKKNTSISPTLPLRVGSGSGTAPQPPAAQLKQMSMEASCLQKIRQNRRMMATIYFVEGGKKDSVTMPHLVEEMNKTTPVIEAGGVSHAWETVRGDIVIAFRVPQTYVTWKASDTMLAQFADLWTEGSSPYLRFGGDNTIYVLELEVVRGGDRHFYWPVVIKEIEQQLAGILNISSTSTPHLLSFLAGMTWSRKWMRFDGYGSDIERLLLEKWPQSYKRMLRYRSLDVEIEISMNFLYIADEFDFRT